MSDLSSGELRATGDRVLLRRVMARTESIIIAGEVLGLTDPVLQIGEVLGMGREWIEGPLRSLELQVGDLVVYNQARVFDHFKWHLADSGETDVLVYPGDWVLGVVRDGILAQHPELRMYGKTLV